MAAFSEGQQMFRKRNNSVGWSTRAAAPLLGAVLASSVGGTAFAETVKVTLSDHGAPADLPTGLGMGMPGADMSKAPMMVTASPATVKAGTVTFEVTNRSKDLVHEMLVIPVPTDLKELPYDKDNVAIDEATAGSLGEVKERDPGARGSLTVDLKPGKYILLCNVPGHYAAGMWTLLTVVPKPSLTQ
jgi:uncharacterized cupredoxin-like copper-binding protein